MGCQLLNGTGIPVELGLGLGRLGVVDDGQGGVVEFAVKAVAFAADDRGQVGVAAHGGSEDLLDDERLEALHGADQGEGLAELQFAGFGGLVEAFEPSQEGVLVRRAGEGVVEDSGVAREELAPCSGGRRGRHDLGASGVKEPFAAFRPCFVGAVEARACAIDPTLFADDAFGLIHRRRSPLGCAIGVAAHLERRVEHSRQFVPPDPVGGAHEIGFSVVINVGEVVFFDYFGRSFGRFVRFGVPFRAGVILFRATDILPFWQDKWLGLVNCAFFSRHGLWIEPNQPLFVAVVLPHHAWEAREPDCGDGVGVGSERNDEISNLLGGGDPLISVIC